MRKVFAIALAALCLAGCGKETRTGQSLAGTKWSRVYEDGHQVIEFVGENVVRQYETDKSGTLDGTVNEKPCAIDGMTVTFSQNDGEKLMHGNHFTIVGGERYIYQRGTASGDILTINVRVEFVVVNFETVNGKLTATETVQDKGTASVTFMREK